MTISYLRNRIYHELVFLLAKAGIIGRRLKVSGKFDLSIPPRTVRKILRRNDSYYDKEGVPTWWFAAYMIKRNTCDELSTAVLEYITDNTPKDSNVLVTG